MLTVRKATEEDAISLSKRLRRADLEEIEAQGQSTPEESLLTGVKVSDVCFVAVDAEDVPQIIFGIAPSPDPVLGFIWMMASDALKDNWIQVLRETRAWLDSLLGYYKVVGNVVHASNSVHIRWLRWAGFTFLREVHVNGNTFYEFAKLNTLRGH